MTRTVELPLWLLVLILLFAAVTFASHFLFPSVRWFFRRRLERAVARVNERLERPIQPFKLARRYDTIQRLIYDPQVMKAITDHAREEGVPENVAFESARRYAREIVPSFSASLYFGFAIRLARFLGNALYRVRLGHLDENALRAIDPDATVVFVINHRSNMDYVLVTYLAANRSALSYAVGEWARVWPLSRLIRSMGAYFIRRKSRSELYRKVLAAYVRLANEGGVTQAMFPEGGLSLTGKLMPLKLGLLKYILDDFDPEGRDVVFVPVALNYDRVLEDEILTQAAREGNRRFRAGIGIVARSALSLLGLWVMRRYHRHGYAGVNFGRPLSLRAFSGDRSGDLTVPMARELHRRLSGIIPITPVPALAWLLQARGAMSRDAIRAEMPALLTGLSSADTPPPPFRIETAIELGLKRMQERGLIIERDGRLEPAADKAHLLEFYANSIRHLMPSAPGPDMGAGKNAAQAKQISATARS
ncbi:1-acyl-sn-glycerol-3-phosphate acyltransferase [Pukyongiella litopenaei]|uniref:Glycerol-3-phosphate acyltransferase n=1 Tax=Pukyongiella litopenaei TaxID=2605946 RepID=A0A2S0MQJ1_9RHOB|nr:1-acyl-sn-glycerol-3-phosphate acyltransferase [Pukyongiella litopenaei]AVO38106.1 glycerol-3-phosphate acyltransferase [Pukyongiella litopenaei]